MNLIQSKILEKYIFILICCLAFWSCSGSKKLAHNTSSTNVNTVKVNRNSLVNYAKTFMGVPYKYGGNTPKEGFDCSGYVKYVFSHYNVNVPRITKDYANFGNRVSLKQAQIGDLILFSLYDDKNTIGHIGIISSTDGVPIKFLHAASGAKSRKVMESELKDVHLSRMLFVTRVVE